MNVRVLMMDMPSIGQIIRTKPNIGPRRGTSDHHAQRRTLCGCGGIRKFRHPIPITGLFAIPPQNAKNPIAMAGLCARNVKQKLVGGVRFEFATNGLNVPSANTRHPGSERQPPAHGPALRRRWRANDTVHHQKGQEPVPLLREPPSVPGKITKQDTQRTAARLGN